MIVDTHQHFWNYNSSEFGWIDASMQKLKRDFLPADLEPHLIRSGISGTVAVQARQSLKETDWLLELSAGNSFIKGVVGWFELNSPDLQSVLERYTGRSKLVGARHLLQDEPDDRYMLQPAFLRGMKLLEAAGLSFDLLIYPGHLAHACQLAGRFPDQRFVLDHLSKPSIRTRQLQPWKGGIRELSKYPNVWCKVSGMVTEADHRKWRYEDFVPYLDYVFGEFGTDRILLGSDWPVSTLAGRYEEVMGIPLRYMEGRPAEEQERVYRLNAVECYHLDELLP